MNPGTGVDARDNESYTALVLASRNGHREAVGILIEAGADASIATKHGGAAYSNAELRDHGEIVGLMEAATG